MEISIRQELPTDYHTTEAIIKKAFQDEEYSDKREHLLVNRIKNSDAFIPELSFVAESQSKEILGHILLSKITIVHGDYSVDSLALAPVSVLPAYQKQGIGSQLISTALKKAEELGFSSVIVLGHKDYYPRFGFKPAHLWNIRAPFEVPDEVFMALELKENALANVEGVVHYSDAFSE